MVRKHLPIQDIFKELKALHKAASSNHNYSNITKYNYRLQTVDCNLSKEHVEVFHKVASLDHKYSINN